jgi:hypothetical protein
MQSIPAIPYRNKRIEIRAAIRVSAKPTDGQAHMWFRVDRPGGRMGAFDNMHDRPVRSRTWQYYTISADVDDDAEQVNLGLFTLNGATAWWDDVHVITIADLTTLKELARPPEPIAMLEETVKSRTASLGSDHLDTLNAMNALALAYERAGRLADAKPIELQILASVRQRSDRETASVAAFLAQCAYMRLVASEFAQAEPFARASLAIREKLMPDDRLTFHTRSMLGGALLGQHKLAEAEPLLRSGYEGLKASEETLPSVGRILIQESLERLVQLYEAKADAVQAGEWKQKLAEFEEAETEKEPAVPQP